MPNGGLLNTVYRSIYSERAVAVAMGEFPEMLRAKSKYSLANGLQEYSVCYI